MIYIVYTMFYIVIRHNNNNYLLCSCKLTGSPLLVFIMARGVHKTSFYNFKLFVVHDTLILQPHTRQHLPFPCSTDTQCHWAWMHISCTRTSMCFLLHKNSLFPNIGFSFTTAGIRVTIVGNRY